MRNCVSSRRSALLPETDAPRRIANTQVSLAASPCALQAIKFEWLTFTIKGPSATRRFYLLRALGVRIFVADLEIETYARHASLLGLGEGLSYMPGDVDSGSQAERSN
jgi:hypothetical protein